MVVVHPRPLDATEGGATTKPVTDAARATARTPSRGRLTRWLGSTDHKVIGNLYLATSFGFYLVGGVLALLMRAELFTPGIQVVRSMDQYNQLFTMHGTIMLLLFATPAFAGFANALMPLQIGAPDVAFPRLNMFAFWLFLFGGAIAVSGLFLPGGAAAFGWTAYAPLSSTTYSPGLGGDLWVMGLALGGFGTILGAVNFITTIVTMRAPGMTMFRMPVFTWNVLITSVLILMAFPPLAAALLGLGSDRLLGTHIFAAEHGGAILWRVGAFVLGLSTLVFLYNAYRSLTRGARVTEDDPWGYGGSLEWTTSCRPPRHNFAALPRIRSERPAFDLHHPEAGVTIPASG